MGTQSANGVLGYIRGELADHRSEGVDSHLLVALDEPVGQFVVHEHVPPAGGVAIVPPGLALGYDHLDADYLRD